jgi:hypothetical protein
MWKAYERLGGAKSAPDVNPKVLEFPICEKSKNFKTATFHGIPLPDELKAWISAIQPCHAGERIAGSEEDITSRNLLLVNDCARIDRHRHLHIIGTVVSSSSALVECSSPATITYVQSVSANPLQGEYEIAVFGIDGMTPDTEIQVDCNFTIHITVKEIPDDVDLMIRLFQLKDQVAGVIRRFECVIK